MNWKNITIESGFLKQEINLKGLKATSYIPLEKVDSFGVVNTESKKFLYAAIFLGLCTVFCMLSRLPPQAVCHNNSCNW